MEYEVAVAASYGMHFPVGDTTGAPGLVRGLSAAVTYAGFADQIAEHAPQSWVVNYTNPMTICTRTLRRVVPELKVFGCCHEVFGTQKIPFQVAQKQIGLPDTAHHKEIKVNVLGIDHFT